MGDKLLGEISAIERRSELALLAGFIPRLRQALTISTAPEPVRIPIAQKDRDRSHHG